MGIFQKYLQTIIIIAIIFVVNIISNFYFLTVDLTDDKRFSIAESTKNIIAIPDDNIYIKVLLDGEFPSGFQRLRAATKDLLFKFKDYNSNIVFEFEDPNSGSQRELIQRKEMLEKNKISPVALSYSDGTKVVQKAIFPFAIINYKNRKFIVNLLEEQMPGDDENEVLNRSVALLEYKFADSFQKLISKRPKKILLTKGNGEWEDDQLARLQIEVGKFHQIGRVDLDSIMRLDTTIDLVIVAGPKKPMELKNQFKLDQYIMQGGKIIWLLDKINVSLDSINKYKLYIPPDFDLGIDDMLFKYGVKIFPDLVMDLECTSIPQVVGMQGDKPQTKLFPWVYHLSVANTSSHPITKNLDRINLFFPSSLDTVATAGNVEKTILLKSSRYSRTQLSPVRLSFEMLKTSPDPNKFNSGNKPLAILLEGEFESFFKNRLTPEFKKTLDQINMEFLENSKPAKQLIVSDSDFAKNLVNYNTGETEQIGFNKWERKYYKGNKDFIINSIEYMLDENNILESRSKEVKLRMLDGVKTKTEKTKWQLINVGLPVLILIIFGFIYTFLRRKKYA